MEQAKPLRDLGPRRVEDVDESRLRTTPGGVAVLPPSDEDEHGGRWNYMEEAAYHREHGERPQGTVRDPARQVACRVCGEPVRADERSLLPAHLSSEHSMDEEEYKEQYRGAPLVAPEPLPTLFFGDVGALGPYEKTADLPRDLASAF